MKYMIVFDEQDKDLVDGVISDATYRFRVASSPEARRLADRLEGLAIIPVPEATATQVDQATGDPGGLPLVAQVMHQSHVQDTAMRQTLIDSLQWDLDRLQATLQLITSDIEDLYSHPWNPRGFHVRAALCPDHDRVEQRARSLRAGRWE